MEPGAETRVRVSFRFEPKVYYEIVSIATSTDQTVTSLVEKGMKLVCRKEALCRKRKKNALSVARK